MRTQLSAALVERKMPRSAIHVPIRYKAGVRGAGRGLAEAECVNPVDVAQRGERHAAIGRVVQAVEGGQPQVAFFAWRGVDAVLAAAVVAAVAIRSRGSADRRAA